MTPTFQRVFDDGAGDCFAACLATVLDVPLDTVPKFKRIQEENEHGHDMIMQADKWLREVHGKRFISIELYKPNGGELTTQVILNRLFYANEGEHVLLSGESPRKNKDGTTKFHCVVAKADCWGFDIVHDPHPDGGGIVGQPFGVKWIVPI